jgi:hypothetical protein
VRFRAEKENRERYRKKLSGVDTHGVLSGLTTQAQRPGARDATIATATLPPGSLQRMVRRHLKSWWC